MTVEQRHILNELAEFAPALKPHRRACVHVDRWAAMRNYLIKNSRCIRVRNGFTSVTLHELIEVKYRLSQSIYGEYRYAVEVKIKT
jgi:hypothetical protein